MTALPLPKWIKSAKILTSNNKPIIDEDAITIFSFLLLFCLRIQKTAQRTIVITDSTMPIRINKKPIESSYLIMPGARNIKKQKKQRVHVIIDNTFST